MKRPLPNDRADTAQKTNIRPDILQQHLESAANAAQKGQAQYFTPVPWAEVLSLPLPNYRPVVVDLTCGNGQFRAGAAGPSTHTVSAATLRRCPQSSTLNSQPISSLPT